MSEIPIYPERPICMYIGEKRVTTYRLPGKERLLRRPFENRLVWMDPHTYSKHERKNIAEEKCLPLRCFTHGTDLMCVSTRDIENPKQMYPFAPAERIPFRTGREMTEKWIHLHFDVEEMWFLSGNDYLKVKGSLKEGNQLSSHKRTLLVFKTCGEGGGMTKSGPCKNMPAHDGSALSHYSPFYGRCKRHPREINDQSIWRNDEKTFTGKATFVFTEDSISVFEEGSARSKGFTHLNDWMINL